MPRQRDVLPLPLPFPRSGPLPETLGRLMRVSHSAEGWRSWCNEGVSTLNRLYGGSRGPRSAPNFAQQVSLEHLAELFKDVGPPPPDLSPALAFTELTREALPYASNVGAPVPFESGRVSLPEGGATLVRLADVLPSEHLDLLSEGSGLLLNPDFGPDKFFDFHPFHDAAFRRPRIYAAFLGEIRERDLVEWQVGGPSFLGAFFVPKKDGKLRLILDTRGVNEAFLPPPRVRLPTAAALTAVEAIRGQEIFFSGGDIDNCFYRFEAPDVAKPFFTLPGIRARHLGVDVCKRDGLDPASWIVPRLRALPMGWSWSLWFAQVSHEEVGRRVGQHDGTAIQDRSVPRPLSLGGALHAKYVDNFLVCGHSPGEVQRGANSLETALSEAGLAVHEGFGPSVRATFAGIELDGERQTARVAKKRVWKLRLACDLILDARSISGAALEVLIGHFTWACLARREALCVLDDAYRFVRAHYLVAAPCGPAWSLRSGLCAPFCRCWCVISVRLGQVGSRPRTPV